MAEETGGRRSDESSQFALARVQETLDAQAKQRENFSTKAAVILAAVGVVAASQTATALPEEPCTRLVYVVLGAVVRAGLLVSGLTAVIVLWVRPYDIGPPPRRLADLTATPGPPISELLAETLRYRAGAYERNKRTLTKVTSALKVSIVAFAASVVIQFVASFARWVAE